MQEASAAARSLGAHPRPTPDLIPMAHSTGTLLPPKTRLLVTLATYNERDNLAGLVGEVFAEAPSADVLVIDDNSPDGTGTLADDLASGDSRIRVLHRPGKLGLGTALLASMR